MFKKRRSKLHSNLKSAEGAIAVGMCFCLVLPYLTTLLLKTDSTGDHVKKTDVLKKKRPRPTVTPDCFVLPWSDMNLKEKANCGLEKCFFRSVSNSSLGYLVGGSDQYDRMSLAATLALKLEEEFGAKHFYSTLPQRVNVTEPFLDLLNGLIYQPNRELVEGWEQQDVFGKDDDLSNVVVQKVTVAPEPSLFMAVTSQNHKVMLAHVDEFRKVVPDKKAFEKQFKNELGVMENVLRGYPQLHYDFQGLADVHGNFYYIDLDGHTHLEEHRPKQMVRILVRNHLKTLRHIMWTLIAQEKLT